MSSKASQYEASNYVVTVAGRWTVTAMQKLRRRQAQVKEAAQLYAQEADGGDLLPEVKKVCLLTSRILQGCLAAPLTLEG